MTTLETIAACVFSVVIVAAILPLIIWLSNEEMRLWQKGPYDPLLPDLVRREKKDD